MKFSLTVLIFDTLFMILFKKDIEMDCNSGLCTVMMNSRLQIMLSSNF